MEQRLLSSPARSSSPQQRVRAFGLDTRSAWIESQHCTEASIVVSKDNLSIGPGEYSPVILERHICTPSVGGARNIGDNLNPYSFGSRSRINSRSSQRPGSDYSIVLDSRGTWIDRSSETTTFHEHDRRQPLDPYRRFERSDSSGLLHGGPTEYVTIFGPHKVKRVNFGHNDIPFGERNETRLALPTYAIKYDSAMIKKKTQLGVIPRSKRTTIFDSLPDAEPVDPSPPKLEQVVEKTAPSPPSPQRKITFKKTEEPHFDASCYTSTKKSLPVDLSPGYIRSQVRSNMFGGVLTVPRLHASKQLESHIAQRLSKYV